MAGLCLLGLSLLPGFALAQSLEDKRAVLEAELAQLEAEIKAQEAELAKQKANSNSIQGEVNAIANQIAITRNKILGKTREITQISEEISDKEDQIYGLDEQLERQKESLARILRKKYQLDQSNVVELLLSSERISDFFIDSDSYVYINDALQQSFEEIRSTRTLTEAEKRALEQKRAQEAEVKAALDRERAQKQSEEAEQKRLLDASRNVEKSYESVIADRKARAAEVRAALFELRGTDGIPFGQAVDYARLAEQKTGVRAALVLGILKQESNLGKNVGTCNRPQDTRKWYDIMPGPDDNSWRDDQTMYKALMAELGRPLEGTPLSCPLPGVPGWGGAMGPSQFIPTTWNAYKDRIAKSVGASVADPWNPYHAITATALYLEDLGADKGGFDNERNAACKYYSGRDCYAKNVVNMFYGNAVLAHADAIQEQMDLIDEF